MSDIHALIQSRRTAHLWADAPVPEDVLERAFEAANMAPCHKFTWPWRFTIAGPRARQRIFERGLVMKAKGGEITERLRAKVTAKMKNPAYLVVATQVRSDDAFRSKEDYAACSCAIQNFALSVHADGFASKWSTGGVTRHADTYADLGIDESAEEIIGFLWVGVPQGSLPNAPERPPVSEFVRTSE